MMKVFGLEVAHFMPIVFVLVFFMTSLSIADRILAVFKKKSSIGDSIDDRDGHRVFNLFFERFQCLKEEIVKHLASAHFLEEYATESEKEIPPEPIVSKELREIQLTLESS